MNARARDSRVATRVALLAGLAGVATACRTTVAEIAAPPMVEQFQSNLPEWAGGSALDVVVLLYVPKLPMLASGTVVAPDLVLTAAHVVRKLSPAADGWCELEIEGRPAHVRIEASGDPELPHGDWALLRLRAPRFPNAATLHVPSFAAEWQPPTGTELVLAGFAKGFFPNAVVDVTAPTPGITVRACEPPEEPGTEAAARPAAPSWCAKGGSFHLGGMSGGAAMIRGGESGRPELVGVFTAYVRTQVVRTVQREFLGMPMGRDETVSSEIVYTIERLPIDALRVALARADAVGTRTHEAPAR